MVLQECAEDRGSSPRTRLGGSYPSHKIGVLAFSAVNTHFDERLYLAVDAADKVSCRDSGAEPWCAVSHQKRARIVNKFGKARLDRFDGTERL